MTRNISQEEVSEDVRDTYGQWKNDYVREVENRPGHYYVEYNDHGSTVSEAHGFGMLIMVSMAQFDLDTREYFDGMVRYFKHHPSSGNSSLMAWKQIRQVDGNMVDENAYETWSATDGDMDIAYALLLADQYWGSDGEFDYRAEALQIIEALMESVVNPELWTLQLGDWVNNDDPLFGTASRTSDWMLGHLYVFYEETKDARWKKVIESTLDVLTDLQNQSVAGLVPDFVWKKDGIWGPVDPGFLESIHDSSYFYNACRVPWRLTEAYYMTKDKRIKEYLTLLNNSMIDRTNMDPNNIMAGYNLDGTPLSSFSDMAFIAPLAVSATIDQTNQEWFNRLWNRITREYDRDKESNYYNDSLRLLSMISISGTRGQVH
ncbi:glycosyl hydrolase family 8 [Halalkalibacter okhensis]|uniref:glycosyl hydrolase family 8 n=1 Tax=Halalkalibacter okhensis TaxID=333138 RepID=UPI000A8E7328|nr:glycosyl hydrolase family 8 [Halalkalibacter okhensis]